MGSVSSKLAPAIPASLQHPTFSFVEHGLSDLRAEECLYWIARVPMRQGLSKLQRRSRRLVRLHASALLHFTALRTSEQLKRCGWPPSGNRTIAFLTILTIRKAGKVVQQRASCTGRSELCGSVCSQLCSQVCGAVRIRSRQGRISGPKKIVFFAVGTPKLSTVRSRLYRSLSLQVRTQYLIFRVQKC